MPIREQWRIPVAEREPVQAPLAAAERERDDAKAEVAQLRAKLEAVTRGRDSIADEMVAAARRQGWKGEAKASEPCWFMEDCHPCRLPRGHAGACSTVADPRPTAAPAKAEPGSGGGKE